MKLCRRVTLKGGLWMGLLGLAGCSSKTPRPELAVHPPQRPDKIVCSGFAAEQVSILPLTRLVNPSAPDADAYIQAYVTLADEFGVLLKFPGTFRFEISVS